MSGRGRRALAGTKPTSEAYTPIYAHPDWEAVAFLYALGYTRSEIARELKKDLSHVGQTLKRPVVQARVQALTYEGPDALKVLETQALQVYGRVLRKYLSMREGEEVDPKIENVAIQVAKDILNRQQGVPTGNSKPAPVIVINNKIPFLGGALPPGAGEDAQTVIDVTNEANKAKKQEKGKNSRKNPRKIEETPATKGNE